jgi:hypothetical protein
VQCTVCMYSMCMSKISTIKTIYSFSSRMAVGLTARRIHMAATQLGAPQQIRQRAHHHGTGLVSYTPQPCLPAGQGLHRHLLLASH